MAFLKQIKFGGSVNQIAMTQVAINEDSQKVLDVVGTNTKVSDDADPVYTISLAVDGKTITKTGDAGLETALGLSVKAAEGEKKARISLVDNEGGEKSSVNIEDIVGNGVITGTSYDEKTGILTITWAGGSETEVNLGKLLDIDDVAIADGSTNYLGLAVDGEASETGGSQAKFSAKIATVTGTDNTLTVNTENGSLLDATNAITAVKTYIDGKSDNLSVEAEGDDYITAEVDETNNKKINVTADVQDLTASAGTPGDYDTEGKETTAPVAGTLSGTEKSLVDGADVATKVKTYVDGAVAIEVKRVDNAILAAVNGLDATVGSQEIASGKHVAVEVVETDGKLTALTVVEDDIASAQGLSDEVSRAKAAEKELADLVGVTGDETERAWVATENYGTDAKSVKETVDALDTQLKKVSDDAAAIQYKVSGTTLEFFGITAKTEK